MPFAGMSEDKRLEVAESTRQEMETLAGRLRDLIAAQPPLDLLGYIYGQRLLTSLPKSEASQKEHGLSDTLVDDTQLALEYLHATLASTSQVDNLSLDETACAELFELITRLKAAALMHAMATSAGTEDGAFGPDTADMEFQAKSTWVMLRGNRYQVLEGEFYRYVLAPHDSISCEEYGMGAPDIAAGFQSLASAIRTGQSEAFEALAKHMDDVQTLAEGGRVPFEEAIAAWAAGHPERHRAATLGMDDMLRGGICNVSRHTQLPPALLADLAYERGEDTEFFAEGPYCGTPFRTLPARKKPLIKIDNDYYGVDTCLTRDASYRALLWNLLRRRPEYAERFKAGQKLMSESAFSDIFSAQLTGATVYREVYYRDVQSREWVENDTLIVIDDLLLLVEAKAGAAATIASPATDFDRHARAIKDLVLKAYQQCRRFFDYLASADEVTVFKRVDGRYVPTGQLRCAQYRVLIPIGLTVESFSPVSTMCKELPEVVPLLGVHPFLCLSIDDLFVLNRFLPTLGELAHYFEVRQVLAGMKGVRLFDEIDHLGAYITKNRFDQDIEEQRVKEKPTLVVWDGMSKLVDDYFSQPDWEKEPIPQQECPTELRGLLAALDRTRLPGWLAAESHLRNYGEKGRLDLATALGTLRASLAQHPHRYLSIAGEETLFVWLQGTTKPMDLDAVRDKARAAMLATQSTCMMAIAVVASPTDGYLSARRIDVVLPRERTAENHHIFDDAESMRTRISRIEGTGGNKPSAAPRPGRNEPCWCGSGTKFKKCHGRQP
jgi:SEC-C motif-containing protein